MSENLTVYGLIPARKGSTGLPGKNRLLLGDLSLVSHACEQALRSSLTHTFLDTDDTDLINEVKWKHPNIVIPYVRPGYLSGSSTEAMEVIEHFLQWIEKSSYPMCDALCWLQPTSPFRTPEDIDACLKMLHDAPSVVSMVETGGMNPYKMKTIDESGVLHPVLSDLKVTNRQKLPKTFICNGAVFLATVGQLRDKRSFYSSETLAYVMPKERSVNIDDNVDFKLAQVLHELNR